MGPRWFFEGLAIYFAGQFATKIKGSASANWQEITEILEQDATDSLPSPVYPTYARVFQSLANSIPIAWMIEHAADTAFVVELEQRYVGTS